jgi:PAS domain S-box-containing protein
MTALADDPNSGFLAGGGRLGALIRAKDWTKTSLGPPDSWPLSLRISVSTCLNCAFPVLIWWGTDFVKIYNDAYSDIIGAKHPAALGSPGELVWPEIWDIIGPMLNRVLHQGEAMPADDLQLILHRHGYPEECYFSFSYSPIRDENGRIAGVFCPVIETTRRVFAERRATALLSLEAAFRDLPSRSAIQTAGCRSLALHLEVACAGYAEANGIDGDAFLIESEWSDGRVSNTIGSRTLPVLGPMARDLRAGVVVNVTDIAFDSRTNEAATLEVFRSRKIAAVLNIPIIRGGSLVAILVATHPEPRRWTEHQIIYARDLADRTWSACERAGAEAALRLSEAEFRTLGENLPNLCWMAHADGSIYWYNQAWCDYTGVPLESLAGWGSEAIHDPDVLPLVKERWAHSIATGTPFEMTFPLLGRDGVYRPFLTRIVPVRNVEGAIVKWFGSNVDISEQRAIEDQLRRSEARLQHLNDNLEQQVAERTEDRNRMWRLSTDLMVVAGDGEIFMAINPAWTALLGWREDELIGRPMIDFIHPEDRVASDRAAQKVETGDTVLRYENRYRHKEGPYYWISWAAVPHEGFVHGIGRNITSEKSSAERLAIVQERLAQAQRMEALGQLAGGIAHDFNNLLQAVTGGLKLMERRAGDADAVRSLAAMVGASAARGQSITGRLLAFARRDELAAVTVPADELLAGLREMLTHTLGGSIQIETEWSEPVPSLFADRAQLETVLVNLGINARDAMPDGGILKLSARAEIMLADNAFGLIAGDYVRIDVVDTGTGMDAATLARAGDPFFTTKPVGKGTGLGLAMARGFAQQSLGMMHVSSTLGSGTTVVLWLPQAEITAGVAVRPERTDATAHPVGGSRVLLVDDEVTVRQIVGAYLEDRGFVVVHAASGLDALSKIEQGERPDLLVTDYAMPGMSGLALMEEVRKRLPKLPVVLLTGYADPAISEKLEGIKDIPTALLRKPISGEELAENAARLLAKNAALEKTS